MKELDAALYNQLSASATTLYGLVAARVYDSLAVQGAALPYVVYNWMGGGDLNLTQKDFIDVLYQVKGLATNLGVARNIDSAIRDRLHNATFSISGWDQIACMREGEVNYSEVVDGVLVWHRGALYRIRCSK